MYKKQDEIDLDSSDSDGANMLLPEKRKRILRKYYSYAYLSVLRSGQLQLNQKMFNCVYVQVVTWAAGLPDIYCMPKGEGLIMQITTAHITSDKYHYSKLKPA